MEKLVIALTGGIGSGKSAVSHFFSDLGIDVIDTDIIARDLVQPGQPALEKVVEHFGEGMIDHKGLLKRALLRKKIFANPQEKLWLENLLHPLIRQETNKRVANSKSPYCIVAIPLYFETQKNEIINRVLVVETPMEVRIKRVMERDHCSEADVKKIMSSQVSENARREGADDVIENNASLENLREQVRELHQFYSSL